MIKSIVSILYFVVAVSCVDVNSVRERSCFKVNTVPVDNNWASTISTFYYTLMSKSDLYYASADVLGRDPEYICESEIYSNSCMRWNVDEKGGILVTGFSNHSREYTGSPHKFSILEEFDFRPTYLGQIWGYAGVKYTTLTDNSTYIFTAFCNKHGEMTWGVASTISKLPNATANEVREHARDLGFKEEYFTEVDYSNCQF